MQHEHLVPEIIKNIVNQFNPNNKFSSGSEKFNAEARLRAIIEYCENGLSIKKK